MSPPNRKNKMRIKRERNYCSERPKKCDKKETASATYTALYTRFYRFAFCSATKFTCLCASFIPDIWFAFGRNCTHCQYRGNAFGDPEASSIRGPLVFMYFVSISLDLKLIEFDANVLISMIFIVGLQAVEESVRTKIESKIKLNRN